MTGFGASGPAEKVYEYFNMPAKVVKAAWRQRLAHARGQALMPNVGIGRQLGAFLGASLTPRHEAVLVDSRENLHAWSLLMWRYCF